jgi:hypothetical protein
MHNLRSDTGDRRPAVRLEGNHSDTHCGCAAVWDALCQIAARKGWRIAAPGEPYDALIVNGEGTMHHSLAGFHSKMKMLAEAVEAGKPAYLLNTVWQENSDQYDNLLRRLSGIAVREVLSQSDLLERHGIRSRLSVDLAYFAPIARRSLRDFFKRGPLATDCFVHDAGTWGPIPDIPDVPTIDMSAMSWPSFVSSLRTSSLLISGRHHAVIAACRAEIPFAAVESNTHKISGTIASSGATIPVAKDLGELPDIVRFVARTPGAFRKHFRWLRGQDPAMGVPAPGEIWPVTS